MKVAIVGARAHPDPALVIRYVEGLPEEDIVISGGAIGVDTAAEVAARRAGRRVIIWHPEGPTRRCLGPNVDITRPVILGRVDKQVLGRDALMLRNTLIALDCDRMVLFPDGSKGGCWDAAREAVRFKRPVELQWVDGRVQDYLGGFAKRNRK